MVESSFDIGERIVYELEEWEPEPRALLSRALASKSIPFLWEGDGELVVRPVDEAQVDEILDEIERSAALGVELSGSPDVDADADADADEVDYDAVSELFLAADRLLHDPAHSKLVVDTVRATEAVMGGAPPFGFAPEEWARVQALVSSLHEALTSQATVGPEVVAKEARQVRDLLHRYV
jgi:hypothetical protein